MYNSDVTAELQGVIFGFSNAGFTRNRVTASWNSSSPQSLSLTLKEIRI